MTGAPRYYPVVVFDLDGTLLRHTTVSLLLAQHLGHAQEIAELERAYAAGEISNRAIADASAAWLAGRGTTEISTALTTGSWINGIDETLRALVQAGSDVLLATVTLSFVAELLRERYGFAASSGTEMEVIDGALGGKVTRYFDEHDMLGCRAQRDGGCPPRSKLRARYRRPARSPAPADSRRNTRTSRPEPGGQRVLQPHVGPLPDPRDAPQRAGRPPSRPPRRLEAQDDPSTVDARPDDAGEPAPSPSSQASAPSPAAAAATSSPSTFSSRARPRGAWPSRDLPCDATRPKP